MDAALFINNKDVAATGGRMFERRDPLNGSLCHISGPTVQSRRSRRVPSLPPHRQTILSAVVELDQCDRLVVYPYFEGEYFTPGARDDEAGAARK